MRPRAISAQPVCVKTMIYLRLLIYIIIQSFFCVHFFFFLTLLDSWCKPRYILTVFLRWEIIVILWSTLKARRVLLSHHDVNAKESIWSYFTHLWNMLWGLTGVTWDGVALLGLTGYMSWIIWHRTKQQNLERQIEWRNETIPIILRSVA